MSHWIEKKLRFVLVAKMKHNVQENPLFLALLSEIIAIFAHTIKTPTRFPRKNKVQRKPGYP